LRKACKKKGYLLKTNRDIEARAWKYIDGCADYLLNKFPTTLEEDAEMLEKDLKESTLTRN